MNNTKIQEEERMFWAVLGEKCRNWRKTPLPQNTLLVRQPVIKEADGDTLSF